VSIAVSRSPAVCISCGAFFDREGSDRRSRYCPEHRKGDVESVEKRSTSDRTRTVDAILDAVEKRLERADALMRPLEARRDLVLRNVRAREALR
jgi:predicted  nucleic acid-binding Zn-ribbon protein